MEGVLFQATIFLTAAVIAVPISARLGLGSVLGYLAAGIAIAQIPGLLGSLAAEELRHVAEFGVVMMLFLIGLELEPRALWDMRHRLLGLCGLQIGITVFAIMAGGMLLGLSWSVALSIGLVFSLSSTAIVLQTLSEKGLMQTQGGRSVFSVLLTQDIAVIPMLVVLPLLALPKTPEMILDETLNRVIDGQQGHHDATGAHQAAHSFIESLPGWGVTLVTILAVATIIIVGVYFTRPIFRFIHAARLREMYTALALLIVVGIGYMMYLVGISPALGAFLAGVVLASSEFRHELESDIAPFKGLLLGLFFITVGAGIKFSLLFSQFFYVVGLAIAIIIIKGAVLFALGWMFSLRGRGLWLFTLSLAQAGEFGFVLINFSGQHNVIPHDLRETLLLMVAISMLITPLLFIIYDWLSKDIDDGSKIGATEEINVTGPVIIAGIGRFGQVANRLLISSGFKTIVLDHDLNAIQRIRSFGVKAFLGDPTRADVLHAAGIKDARVLIVALDSQEQALQLVRLARRERPDLHIIARAKDQSHVFKLFQAGANDIVRETFDSSLRVGRYALENLGLTEYEASEIVKTFYQHDRYSVRELAGLWKPEIPIFKNTEYITRAMQLEKELETMVLDQMEDNISRANPSDEDGSDGKNVSEN